MKLLEYITMTDKELTLKSHYQVTKNNDNVYALDNLITEYLNIDKNGPESFGLLKILANSPIEIVKGFMEE